MSDCPPGRRVDFHIFILFVQSIVRMNKDESICINIRVICRATGAESDISLDIFKTKI